MNEQLNKLLDHYKAKKSIINYRMRNIPDKEKTGWTWMWLQTKDKDYADMIRNLEIVIKQKDKEFE